MSYSFNRLFYGILSFYAFLVNLKHDRPFAILGEKENMKREFNIATRLLAQEAEERGIKTEVVYPGRVMRFRLGEHDEYTYAQCFSSISSFANRACTHKGVTKALLDRNGLTVAEGEEYWERDLREAIEFAHSKQWNVVLKPSRGEKGSCVFTTIQDESQLQEDWEKLFSRYESALLETKFAGKEYRILATKEKVLGITFRKPANIEGDGQHTIKELIGIKNSDPRRSENCGDPIVKIKIDREVKNKIESSGLTLASVPADGVTVYLRDNSNISTGGDSIDYTDIAHPSVGEIAVKAINSIPGLLYGGVDFMTKDIAKPQNSGSYIIVEMNSSPGIDLHHFPFKGKQRNVAAEVIDIIFPETKR